MYKFDKNGFTKLSKAEDDRVFKEIFDDGDKNYHFLSLDRQLGGFCPIGAYVMHVCPCVLKEEKRIYSSLMARKEVCSLFPKVRISIYPLTRLDGPEYELDLKNISKHFNDILELNDNYYHTPYLYFYTGHGAKNFDGELFKKYLLDLLAKSKELRAIYTDESF